MRILVYGLNYAPEVTGIGKYTGEMCEWLAAKGHEVRVVCAVPYYPEWQVNAKYRGVFYTLEEINDVKIYRSALYVPGKLSVSRRLLHLVSFALLSIPQLIRQLFWRPDVVIAIEPTLFCTPAALVYSLLSGSKNLLHVQDFELDAMLGLGMGGGTKASSVGGSIERWFMRRYDSISSISYSMLDRARIKSGKNDQNLIYFPNWVDIDFVKPGCPTAFLKDRWDIPGGAKVVLYAGNMGKKQGLEIVLDAASKIEDKNVLFILVGAGGARDELEVLARNRGLQNVKFHPLVPYEELPALMALADIHLVVQKKGVADAVLPSKVTTILSAGGYALITAEKGTELEILCTKHPGIATLVEPESPTQFQEALNTMLKQVHESEKGYNLVARKYAESSLEKEQILSRFEASIVNLALSPK